MAEARPLLRACLETYEETLRSDMVGGNESVDLIPPLMLLSYADMLAGIVYNYCAAQMPTEVFNGMRRVFDPRGVGTRAAIDILQLCAFTVDLTGYFHRMACLVIPQTIPPRAPLLWATCRAAGRRSRRRRRQCRAGPNYRRQQSATQRRAPDTSYRRPERHIGGPFGPDPSPGMDGRTAVHGRRSFFGRGVLCAGAEARVAAS